MEVAIFRLAADSWLLSCYVNGSTDGCCPDTISKRVIEVLEKETCWYDHHASDSESDEPKPDDSVYMARLNALWRPHMEALVEEMVHFTSRKELIQFVENERNGVTDYVGPERILEALATIPE